MKNAQVAAISIVSVCIGIGVGAVLAPKLPGFAVWDREADTSTDVAVGATANIPADGSEKVVREFQAIVDSASQDAIRVTLPDTLDAEGQQVAVVLMLADGGAVTA